MKGGFTLVAISVFFIKLNSNRISGNSIQINSKKNREKFYNFPWQHYLPRFFGYNLSLL